VRIEKCLFASKKKADHTVEQSKAFLLLLLAAFLARKQAGQHGKTRPQAHLKSRAFTLI
jgi:hypothetical protein